MSLITDRMESCVFRRKVLQPDNEGGYIYTYENGEHFNAAVVLDNSAQTKTADKQSLKKYYSVFTDKNTVLKYYDIFRRESDGKEFIVTSDGADRATPDISPLNLRVVSAEEWGLEENDKN